MHSAELVQQSGKENSNNDDEITTEIYPKKEFIGWWDPSIFHFFILYLSNG